MQLVTVQTLYLLSVDLQFVVVGLHFSFHVLVVGEGAAQLLVQFVLFLCALFLPVCIACQIGFELTQKVKLYQDAFSMANHAFVHFDTLSSCPQTFQFCFQNLVLFTLRFNLLFKSFLLGGKVDDEFLQIVFFCRKSVYLSVKEVSLRNEVLRLV